MLNRENIKCFEELKNAIIPTFIPGSTSSESTSQEDERKYGIDKLPAPSKPLKHRQKESKITEIEDLTLQYRSFGIEEIQKAYVVLLEAEKEIKGEPVFNDYFKLIFNNVDWISFNKYFKYILLEKDIKTLEKYYSFQEKDKIVNFLCNNFELVFILNEANKQIRKYFLNEVLALKLLQFPGDECWEQLAIKIRTNLSPKEAGNKLEQFENEWWLDNSHGINDQLLINLEFV